MYSRAAWCLGDAKVKTAGESLVVAPRESMELSGLEPLTSWVRSRRSPN
jgi:hypothetical protein